MTELDRALVRRKLARIIRNVRDLETVAGLTLDEYRRDRFRQKAIERLLQETIEAAVDANQHLLAALGRTAATDYFDSFIELGRAGVIGEASARALAPAAGLRNRLVHEYDAIDDAIVLAAVGPACRQFSDYVASVEAYLAAGERR